MHADSSLSIEDLTKEYFLPEVRHNRITERIVSRAPRRRVLRALDNVNAEVDRGTILGLVGRNGAGKSTLLKVLSRITPPSRGRAVLRGSVGTLLEVGTGFHPDLSGRENIFLNGAILGMSRKEVRSRFDDIVDFSELSDFLDAPVKRYSSGMYVRLAFAVAAHLRSDILLVDEVLAVGDAGFRSKSLDKMHEVSRDGRTVVFVSHDLGSIASLCQRALWLDRGKVVKDGEPRDVVHAYLADVRGRDTSPGQLTTAPGCQVDLHRLESTSIPGFRFRNVSLRNPTNPEIGPRTGDPLVISIDFEADRVFREPGFVVSLKDGSGTELLRFSTMPISGYRVASISTDGQIELSIDSLPATSGRWMLDLAFTRAMVEHLLKVPAIVVVDVAEGDVYSSGFPLRRSHGLATTSHHWSLT